MAKVAVGKVKMRLPGGAATPAAPVGPALGQHGVNLMGFCQAFNNATADKKGETVAVKVTIYDDKTFSFATTLAPASHMIKKTLNIKSGSAEPNKIKVAKLTDAQVEEIAKAKMQDLNAYNLEAAKSIIRGTARAMGIEWEEPTS